MLTNARIKQECDAWFLKNYSLSLVDDWLTQCIDFILEDHPVNIQRWETKLAYLTGLVSIFKNKPLHEYPKLIFEQLINFDLIELGTKCLPDSLFNSSAYTLNGSFLVQVYIHL
jgi:hypothetical protein